MAKPDDKIGPYTLVSKLGRGAFGVVWLAEKRSVLATTRVALKLPNDEDIDLTAVKQEAAVWVHASGHPNVLPIIDADIYDEQIVIVSEYAPDGSLSKWLEEHGGKAPSIDLAVEMTLGILAGLEHLHERGIIHRDLKPDNILLQRETPRLADFGIARILKTTSKSTVATGTPAYMPPEAFDGKRSEQTDIWSAGVIFYQLLAGQLPFPHTDLPSLLMAIVTREPEPLPASVPVQFQKLIERALEKDANLRYASAGEMRQALRKASQSQTSRNYKEQETELLPQALKISDYLPVEPLAPEEDEELAELSEEQNSRQLLPTMLPQKEQVRPARSIKLGRKESALIVGIILIAVIGLLTSLNWGSNPVPDVPVSSSEAETSSNSNQTSNAGTTPASSPAPVMNLKETVWEGTRVSRNDQYAFVFEFKSGGKFTERSSGDEFNGTWTQQGNRVFIEITQPARGIEEYKIEGTITGDKMEGYFVFRNDKQSLVAHKTK